MPLLVLGDALPGGRFRERSVLPAPQPPVCRPVDLRGGSRRGCRWGGREPVRPRRSGRAEDRGPEPDRPAEATGELLGCRGTSRQSSPAAYLLGPVDSLVAPSRHLAP